MTTRSPLSDIVSTLLVLSVFTLAGAPWWAIAVIAVFALGPYPVAVVLTLIERRRR